MTIKTTIKLSVKLCGTTYSALGHGLKKGGTDMYALIYDEFDPAKREKKVISVHKTRETAEKAMIKRQRKLGQKVWESHDRIVWVGNPVHKGDQLFSHGAVDIAADNVISAAGIDDLKVVVFGDINDCDILYRFFRIVLFEIEIIFEQIFGAVKKGCGPILEDDFPQPIRVLVNKHTADGAFIFFGRLQRFRLCCNCVR